MASIAALGCSAPTAAVSAPVTPCTTTSAAVVAPLPVEVMREGNAPAIAADSEAAPVLARMESFYGRNAPFSADVTVEQHVRSHNTSKSQQAKLFFEQRGRFRYTFAAGDVVDADSGKLTAYSQATGIAYEHTVPSDYVPASLAFAMAPGTIANHMGVMRFDGVGLNAPGLDVLIGTPRVPHRSISKLLLYVRPSGEVPRLLVIPPSGDRVRFDFANMSTGASSPGSLTLPPTTQTILVSSQPASPIAQSPYLTTIP